MSANHEIFLIDADHAVCFAPSGRFHGWLFRRHPDGQFISVRKLNVTAPYPADHPLAALLGTPDSPAAPTADGGEERCPTCGAKDHRANCGMEGIDAGCDHPERMRLAEEDMAGIFGSVIASTPPPPQSSQLKWSVGESMTLATPIGAGYAIELFNDGTYGLQRHGEGISLHATEAAAKAAAQADYDERRHHPAPPQAQDFAKGAQADTNKLLEKAVSALDYFADAVFNDNGDMTVTGMPFDPEKHILAYQVRRRILAALPTQPGEG